MKIAYFRTSQHGREETQARVRQAAEERGLTILGETALPGGKASVFTLCQASWAETVVAADPKLMGLMPCTVTVVDKGDEVIVGAGSLTLLAAAAPSNAILTMVDEAEAALRGLVESAADVPPPKATALTLYSTHTCPYCTMEKTWLERNEVPHEVVYVDDDQDAARELVMSTGQQGVPQTKVLYDDGSIEYLVGFDKKNLELIVATMKG